MTTASFSDVSADDNVLFVADIHIKPAWSATLETVTGDFEFGLEQILNTALVRKCKLIILGGDVFDRNVLREAEMITKFQAWVRLCTSNRICVAAYPGNHDRVISYGGIPAKQFYDAAPDVVDVNNCVFRFGDRVCYAAGFSDNPAELAEQMVNLPGDVNTVFLHQNLKGVKLPTFNFDEDTVPAGVAEIYVGDIHMPVEGQNVHGAWWGYPGPMFPQEFGEDYCGGMIFKAGAPRHGVASWKRVEFIHRPTKAIDATMIAPSDALLVDRLIADAVKWATDNAVSPRMPLHPLIAVKILSTSREHVTAIKQGIMTQSTAKVVVTYAPPVQKTIKLVNGNVGVPRPVDLIDPYFDLKLKSADGRYLMLRRPAEARALLRALFTPGPRADTAKGRVLAYRSTIKSHLETLT